MEPVSGGRRFLHLVPPGPRPPELSPPPEGHSVVTLPDGDAPPEEWDRLLESVLEHDVVVPW